MSHLTQYNNIVAFITKDGSKIRELMHPNENINANQSLAEATIGIGITTLMHKHIQSEELYHILEGQGSMTLGSKQFNVSTGDTICILPGTEHCICNTGKTILRLLCCCAPPYSHQDTLLIKSD